MLVVNFLMVSVSGVGSWVVLRAMVRLAEGAAPAAVARVGFHPSVLYRLYRLGSAPLQGCLREGGIHGEVAVHEAQRQRLTRYTDIAGTERQLLITQLLGSDLAVTLRYDGLQTE